jgi:RNA-directed DNA polymerase
MPYIQFTHTYDDIISFENLLGAWREFLKGKRGKRDVQDFRYRLSDELAALRAELRNKTYTHGGYYAFRINDPKPRDIHKALVCDRVLHHALYRKLYPFFARTFIADSHSCQLRKGNHRALDRFKKHAASVSMGHTKTVWILKCDVRKFFASIDHKILLRLLRSYIPDPDLIALLSEIVGSFHSGTRGKGLPLGNLTSQLLVNVYMNEFDQFAMHTLKERYIRYADDFVIFSRDRASLLKTSRRINAFLSKRLNLTLHPGKVSIATVAAGVDFLGWVHFPRYRVLRTVTKRRMFRRIEASKRNNATVQSYLGLLTHGNAHALSERVHSLASE